MGALVAGWRGSRSGREGGRERGTEEVPEAADGAAAAPEAGAPGRGGAPKERGGGGADCAALGPPVGRGGGGRMGRAGGGGAGLGGAGRGGGGAAVRGAGAVEAAALGADTGGRLAKGLETAGRVRGCCAGGAGGGVMAGRGGVMAGRGGAGAAGPAPLPAPCWAGAGALRSGGGAAGPVGRAGGGGPGRDRAPLPPAGAGGRLSWAGGGGADGRDGGGIAGLVSEPGPAGPGPAAAATFLRARDPDPATMAALLAACEVLMTDCVDAAPAISVCATMFELHPEPNRKVCLLAYVIAGYMPNTNANPSVNADSTRRETQLSKKRAEARQTSSTQRSKTWSNSFLLVWFR